MPCDCCLDGSRRRFPRVGRGGQVVGGQVLPGVIRSPYACSGPLPNTATWARVPPCPAAPLDAPGVLHHVMVRGIERRALPRRPGPMTTAAPALLPQSRVPRPHGRGDGGDVAHLLNLLVRGKCHGCAVPMVQAHRPALTAGQALEVMSQSGKLQGMEVTFVWPFEVAGGLQGARPLGRVPVPRGGCSRGHGQPSPAWPRSIPGNPHAPGVRWWVGPCACGGQGPPGEGPGHAERLRSDGRFGGAEVLQRILPRSASFADRRGASGETGRYVPSVLKASNGGAGGRRDLECPTSPYNACRQGRWRHRHPAPNVIRWGGRSQSRSPGGLEDVRGEGLAVTAPGGRLGRAPGGAAPDCSRNLMAQVALPTASS